MRGRPEENGGWRFTCSRQHLNLGDGVPQGLHTFSRSWAEGEVLRVVQPQAGGAATAQWGVQPGFHVQLKLQQTRMGVLQGFGHVISRGHEEPRQIEPSRNTESPP